MLAAGWALAIGRGKGAVLPAWRQVFARIGREWGRIHVRILYTSPPSSRPRRGQCLSACSEDNVLGDNIPVSQSSYIAMGIARGARPTASEKHKVGSSLDESHSPQCGSCPSSCHLPSCLLQLRRPDQPDQAQASAQAAAGNAPQTP